MVVQKRRFSLRIALPKLVQVPNSCNFQQHSGYNHIYRPIHMNAFEKMSNPMGRRRSRKYLQLKSQFRTSWNIQSLFLRFLFNSLNPKEHTVTIEIEVRYSRRLPNFLTVEIRKMLAEIPIAALTTVTELALIGVPNALSTWMMYGCQTIIAQNSKKKCKQNIRKNGFSVRFRFSSLTLSQNVGFGWVHLIDFFAHGTQALDTLL